MAGRSLGARDLSPGERAIDGCRERWSERLPRSRLTVDREEPEDREPDVARGLRGDRELFRAFDLPEDRELEVAFDLPEDRELEVAFDLPEDRELEVAFDPPEDRELEEAFEAACCWLGLSLPMASSAGNTNIEPSRAIRHQPR